MVGAGYWAFVLVCCIGVGISWWLDVCVLDDGWMNGWRGAGA